MPTQTIVDFESIDLSKTVATHEEIYAQLKQAGTFALLDEVVHFDTETNLCVGKKVIHADHWWAPDHIPGRPIFPGALMIETGAQLCSWDFMKRRENENDDFVGFGGVNSTRFRGVVEPGSTMYFGARVLRIRKSLFTYEVQGYVDGRMVFESEIMGVIV